MYEDRIVARGGGERREGDDHKLSNTQISNQMSSSRTWLFVFIFFKSMFLRPSKQFLKMKNVSQTRGPQTESRMIVNSLSRFRMEGAEKG